MKVFNFVLIALVVFSTVSCNFLNSKSSYDLTTSVTPEEGGTVNPSSGTFDEGTRIDITAKASENWVFIRWEGDLEGNSSTTSLEFDRNKTVNAVFVLKEYPLSIQVEGEGTVTEEIVENKAKADYEHGTTVRLTAEPEENWQFVRWEGDIEGSENPELITVDGEKSITAVFELKEYPLSILVEGEGTVTEDIVENKAKTDYKHGATVRLTAEPEVDWVFERWEGDIEGHENPVLITVDGEKNVTAIFKVKQNQLFGMGYNHNGQIGDGTIEDRHNPTFSMNDVKAVATGSWHSLLVRSDGTLWGMGYNEYGQLGDGTGVDQHVPVQIASDVSDVAGGEHHSIFVTNDGVLYAMGDNSEGQLGDVTTQTRFSPVQVDTDVKSVAIGEWHSLYIKNDGSLWGMGRNTDNQLSSDTTTKYHHTPVQIDTDVTQVAGGKRFTLYLKSDGTLWAVGRNALGQLGDGTTETRVNPIQVATDVIYVTAGRDHSMFITSDGTLMGMGNNTGGQLGDGTTSDIVSSPIVIDTDVVNASGGNRHTMYIKGDGTLWAMGLNDAGQLGDGTTTQRLEPVLIDTEVIEVSVGIYHNLYIKK